MTARAAAACSQLMLAPFQNRYAYVAITGIAEAGSAQSLNVATFCSLDALRFFI
jgi:hypothetical protein